jgi:hypothetical protein
MKAEIDLVCDSSNVIGSEILCRHSTIDTKSVVVLVIMFGQADLKY